MNDFRGLWVRVAVGMLVLLVAAPATAQEPGDHDDPAPRVPPGFAVTVAADVGGLATSLDWGPDTRTGESGERLYIADYLGGRIAVTDGPGPVTTFADGFTNPLGVLAARDRTVYVSDFDGSRDGPFGRRGYGRVWRVRDTDGDGVADDRDLLLTDLPNGRHNTNGLALGPDGLLYVANGNSTDDGVEGGPPEALPWSGAVVRVDPRRLNQSVARLPKTALVATGGRNLYDVAFSPVDRTKLFIPMNGVDDARAGDPSSGRLENSDDLLFAADTADRGVEDLGFPSCLYNYTRQGDLEPYDNPHPEVARQFGRCNPRRVTRPIASFGLHVSADGLAFQETNSWGPAYRNDLFVAEFGNFFGTEPVGHKVVHVELDPTGAEVVRQSEFLTGAAPLDVTFDRDGAMFVADFSGEILRVDRVVDVPRTVDVQISAYQFVPQVLVIPEGTTIRWTNQDALGLVHNVAGQVSVTSDGATGTGDDISSKDLPIGGQHARLFNRPGVWQYTCAVNAVHAATMHGTIIVVPAGS